MGTIVTQAYKAIENIVGSRYISDDPAIMQGYKSGPGGYEAGLGYERVMTVLPAAVALPKDADELQRMQQVSTVLRLTAMLMMNLSSI